MGKLIAFEGPEGAGKSTQIRHLATTFQSNGHSVLVTREPGGTPTGDAIRLVVLNPNLEIKNNILQIQFRDKFLFRRGRINCSLNDNGSWRWFGVQFSVQTD